MVEAVVRKVEMKKEDQSHYEKAVMRRNNT